MIYILDSASIASTSSSLDSWQKSLVVVKSLILRNHFSLPCNSYYNQNYLQQSRQIRERPHSYTCTSVFIAKCKKSKNDLASHISRVKPIQGLILEISSALISNLSNLWSLSGLKFKSKFRAFKIEKMAYFQALNSQKINFTSNLNGRIYNHLKLQPSKLSQNCNFHPSKLAKIKI